MKYLILILSLLVGNSQASSFTVNHDGYLYGVFGGSSAQYESLISVIVNGFQDSPYQAISNRSTNGQLVNFGWVEAGDKVEFKLEVLDTHDVWYSNTSMNIDGVNHVKYFTGVNNVTIGFEDLYGGGDFDYNDLIATFYNVSPIPEPSIVSMLCLGLFLTLFRKTD